MSTIPPEIKQEAMAQMAFPVVIPTSPTSSEVVAGMWKREYFAALALQGICANTGHAVPTAQDAARFAVDLADALINQLAKPRVTPEVPPPISNPRMLENALKHGSTFQIGPETDLTVSHFVDDKFTIVKGTILVERIGFNELMEKYGWREWTVL